MSPDKGQTHTTISQGRSSSMIQTDTLQEPDDDGSSNIMKDEADHDDEHEQNDFCNDNDKEEELEEGDGFAVGDDYDNDDDDDDDAHDDDSHLFPTLPAFIVPVEIRPTPWLGPNQFGVFATEDIPPHTRFWKWTYRVIPYHYSELDEHIRITYPNVDDYIDIVDTKGGGDEGGDGGISPIEEVRCFLRRGFVLPAPHDDHWYSNPSDAGCYMNHSSEAPNCGQPYGTLRWVRAGEELTMDYRSNGNPRWYIDICHRYGMKTSWEIANGDGDGPDQDVRNRQS